MTWRIIPLLLLALVMGQDDCETEPPPQTKLFCEGSAGSVFADDVRLTYEAVNHYGITNLGVARNAIKHGVPSVDRRGTVKVNFCGMSCSGTIMSPHTVSTAAHCGWNCDEHRISLKQGGHVIATSHENLVHPDYPKYESNGDLVAREADVLLLYTEETLPPPYIQIYQYELEAATCTDILAQGFGQAEQPREVECPTGQSVCLREARYVVNQVDVGYRTDEGRLLRSIDFNQEPGRGCFGDSGGPLYCITPLGPKLCGIMSTTNSLDCEAGSQHVHAGNTEIKQWMMAGIR